MMNKVLAIAAVFEIATGVALILMPEEVAKLLLGTQAQGLAVIVSRVLGVALIALGVACWPGRTFSRLPALAMLLYGSLVSLYFGVLGVRGEFVGPLLWPAFATHAALTIALAVTMVRKGNREVTT